MENSIKGTIALSPPAEPCIIIKKLEFSIAKHKILRDFSCSFDSGRINGLVGPNGSGKSTLLRNICRIWSPERGYIYIQGKNYKKINRKQLSTMLTFIPQNTQVNFSLRVFDFVAMGRHPHIKGLQSLRQKDKDVIKSSLNKTKTSHLTDRYINEISGGEAQLVSIARALATEAPVLLLDEPTSALDIKHKLEIMELLCGLKKEGKTIIMSIHDLELARRYCDTITMLYQGGIYFSGIASVAFSQTRIKEVFDVSVREIYTDQGTSLLFYR